ncbi:flippase [Edwardsiella tarda]|uniref:flippase n=1 Tax=Edwardsiella tarda TaxID=636 RepID=UPI0034DD29BD
MKLDLVIFKNITSLFGIRVAGYIIPLITLPYLVKVLEPIGYGYLSFSIAILQYYILIVNYGFDLSATKKIAQHSNNIEYVSMVFWSVIFLRLVISFVGFLLLVCTINLVPELNKIKLSLIAGYLSVLGAALFPMWLFQGKERLGTVSTIRIILQIISLPLFFIFVNTPNDVWVASLIYTIPQLSISFISFYIIYKRKWVVLRRVKLFEVKNELFDGWHIFISTAAISLYTTTVTVVLGFVSGPYSVAIYTSANKLLQAAQGLYQPISSALYPRISNLMKTNSMLGFSMIRKLFKYQFILTIFISIGLLFFSDFVVHILYGKRYIEAALVLKLLSPIPIIVGCSNILGIQTLLTCGYKKEFSKILILSGVLNIAIIYPLCSMYNAIGAAASVLITEVFVTASMFYVVLNNKIPIWESKREV